MKTSVVVGIAIILGLGVGVGSAVVRLERTRWDGISAVPKADQAPASIPEGPHPSAIVDNDKHDFGALDSHATGRHAFVIRNTGEAILKLTRGDTTCKCTASLLGESGDAAEVHPGESTEVTLEWKGKGFMGPFHQSATIHTNDPEHPRLTLSITGRIVSAVSISPTNLVLSGVSADEGATGELRLYGYQDKPLKITSHEITDQSTADKFSVDYEPLSPEEVAEEQDAKSGFRIQITLKPGLPLGAFQQKIVIHTDAEDAPTVDVPIQGTISSEISIIGAGWSEERQVLSLGPISSRAGLARTLRMLVRGPDRKDVKVEPLSATPDLVKVEVGEPTEWQGGQVVQIPLTIRIPQGSPPANYLVTDKEHPAEIVIGTTHPKAKQLRILLRFAVVD